MSAQNVSLKWDERVVEEVDKLAASERRTRNNMVLVLVLEALAARGIELE